MGFIDNIQSAFNPLPAVPTVQYGTTKDWFLSDAGRGLLNQTQTTVELTDYTYHYLKSIMCNKQMLSEEDLYRVAFVLADSVAHSHLAYGCKENLLNASVHPFVAYFQNVKRSLSTKSLCYEMLLILFGAVDPFNSSEWIYDSGRQGYSEEEYKEIAGSHDLDFKQFLKTECDLQEDLRLIACEIIWLIGKQEFLDVIK